MEQMDNFDHEENTSSGISGSHDVVLVLFQNREAEQNEKSEKLFKNNALLKFQPQMKHQS